MDLQKKRSELMGELQGTSDRAQQMMTEAAALKERATFLRGAIAMLNDQIGPPPEPTPSAPEPDARPLSRAERRHAEKLAKAAAKKANGAALASGKPAE